MYPVAPINVAGPMARGWPTLNTLLVARLMLESSGTPWHTYGVSKQTGLHEESARTALKDMQEHRWITAESSSRRTFYTLTTIGLKAAKAALKPLQLTTYRSS